MNNLTNVIILSGGGGNAAATVGAIKYFFETGHFSENNYDYIMGGSVGATIAAYIATGQFCQLYDLWNEEIPHINPVPFPYIRSYSPNSFLNFIKKGKFALDIKKLKGSIPVSVAIMNRKTKRIEHVEINNHANPFDVLYASCSVPILTKKYVTIDEHSYCDSILVSHPFENTMFALNTYNPKKITVISCMSEKGFELDPDNDRGIFRLERNILGVKHNGIGIIPDLSGIDYTFYAVRPIAGSKFTSVRNCQENLQHGYNLMKDKFMRPIASSI